MENQTTIYYDGSKIADKLIEVNESISAYGAYGYIIAANLKCFVKAIQRYNKEKNDVILESARCLYSGILPKRVTLKALKKFAENQIVTE